MTPNATARGRFLIIALAGFLAILLTPAGAKELDLSGDWKFQFDPDDKGITEGWNKPDYDDSAWGTMVVPGDWGEEMDGVGWYRRVVEVDKDLLAEPNLKLVFMQSDDMTKVWIDGELVVENSHWDVPFFADLTKKAAEAKDGKLRMVLAVRVDDHGVQGGLLRPVYVRSVENVAELFRTEWYDKAPHRTLEELGSLVMYSLYVRNATPEGTFAAYEKHLPELRAMGVNVIWLLPIHEIGVEKRKGPDGSPYAIKDYFSIDPNLGTKDDFRRFVQAAHDNSMQVIIDLVMNHTSPDSVMAIERPELFLQDDNGKPRPGSKDWQDIVDWDWDVRQVYDYNLSAIEYWVREFDIDGYRADVADLMPDDFWQEARARLDAIKPGCLMLAESTSARQHINGFDLTYAEGVRDSAINILTKGAPASALKTTLMGRQFSLPAGACDIQFVENHDKPRAINAYGGPERTRLGAVLTATLPGVTLLYTGTEVGADADRDATFFTRTPVDMTRDLFGMRAFWNGLLALRAKHTALQTGSLTVLDAEPADKVLAYVRDAGESRVLVVLNFADSETTVTLDHELLPEGKVTLGPLSWTLFVR